MNLVNIGFGNLVNADRVVSILLKELFRKQKQTAIL